jgi:CDP-diacylglycerol---glycerol-3-phosphate 3-phosphatidyltransferase
VINRGSLSPELRDRVRGLGLPIALALGRIGFTPNALTVLGFVGTCVAAFAAASAQWTFAGILVLAFGIFDMFDGSLARATGRTSRFGAFLDSTLDRTGENLVLGGVAVGCASLGFTEGVWLAVLAMAFGSIVTYTRARAEALGLRGEVGIAPRPERLVLLSGGLILTGQLRGVAIVPPVGEMCAEGCLQPGAFVLLIALGMIALFSAITIVQRILYVKQQLEQQENQNR